MESPKCRKTSLRSEQPARNRNAVTWNSPRLFLELRDIHKRGSKFREKGNLILEPWGCSLHLAEPVWLIDKETEAQSVTLATALVTCFRV